MGTIKTIHREMAEIGEKTEELKRMLAGMKADNECPECSEVEGRHTNWCVKSE